MLVQRANRCRGLPRIDGGAELVQAAGARGVAGLVQLLRGVAGQGARVVEVVVSSSTVARSASRTARCLMAVRGIFATAPVSASRASSSWPARNVA